MPDGVCLCSGYYRFERHIGVCSRSGEYAILSTVSSEDQHQMRHELDLVLAAHEQGVSIEGSAGRRSDPGR